MALDFEAIKRKLERLSGNNTSRNVMWKPEEGQEYEREKRQDKARREEEKTQEKSNKVKVTKAAALQLKLEVVYTSLQKCCAHPAIAHLPPSLVAPAQKHMAAFKAAIEACAFVKGSPDGRELPDSEALPWKDAKTSEKFILSMLVRVAQHTCA